MALFIRAGFLVSLNLLIIILSVSSVFSLPVKSDVYSPPASPLSEQQLHLNLPKDQNIKNEEYETRNQRNPKTLGTLWDTATSMSMIPNIKAMFESGAKYEWIPLGSLIYNNMFGDGTKSKN